MKPDGGPAFPRAGKTTEEQPPYGFPGMSLRDYFAANCPDVAAINIKYDAEELAGPQPAEGALRELLIWNCRVEAALRYIYADAMLAERSK